MSEFEKELMKLGKRYDIRAHKAEVATSLPQALEDFKHDILVAHNASVREVLERVIGDDEAVGQSKGAGVVDIPVGRIRNALRAEQRKQAELEFNRLGDNK